MAKILIVEDDPLVIRMYETVFERAGMEVLKANSGQEGWELVQSQRPDLIVCDVMMPGRSGLDLLTQVKEDTSTRDIPVVILTNLSGENDRKLALDKGAVDFWVKKDVDPEAMVDEVKKLINAG